MATTTTTRRVSVSTGGAAHYPYPVLAVDAAAFTYSSDGDHLFETVARVVVGVEEVDGVATVTVNVTLLEAGVRVVQTITSGEEE